MSTIVGILTLMSRIHAKHEESFVISRPELVGFLGMSYLYRFDTNNLREVIKHLLYFMDHFIVLLLPCNCILLNFLVTVKAAP